MRLVSGYKVYETLAVLEARISHCIHLQLYTITVVCPGWSI